MLGFDAEDFHTGMGQQDERASLQANLTERIERQILPRCDYVTAAAPLIADQYASKYSIRTPTTILNVFPLDERPDSLREVGQFGRLTMCWFSQTIGPGRGLENVIRALGLITELNIELHLLG